MNRRIKKYNDEYIRDISGAAKDGVIYIGDWYVFENDRKTVKKGKIGAVITSVLSIVLFVIAGFLDAKASFTAYVFMPFIVSFLPIVYSVADGFKLMSYGEKLTHKQYDKTVVNLKQTSLANIILSSLALLGDAVMYAMAYGFDKIEIETPTLDIVFTLCLSAILLLNVLLYSFSKKLVCAPVKNEK